MGKKRERLFQDFNNKVRDEYQNTFPLLKICFKFFGSLQKLMKNSRM